ncbi:MAG: MMPL family transporter [Acidobacteria bacterium]|nr:MMPL family transporter [Acidobacteriota bacterium]
MLSKLIGKLQDLILARPGRVVLFSLLLTVLALAMGSQVEFRTARRDLAPPDDTEQIRFDRIMARISGGSSMVIACAESVEGAPADRAALQTFADALATSFAASPQVANTFHKVDLEWFTRNALWLAPAEELETITGILQGQESLITSLRDVRHLADLNRLVTTHLSRQTGPGAAPSTAEQEQAEQALTALAAALRAEGEFLTSPAEVMDRLRDTDPLAAAVASRVPGGGYMASRDGRLLFIMVTPANEDEGLPVLRALMTDLRARARAVAAEHPGFQVAFTGEPALTVEEMDTVRRDTWRTSTFAALGVTALTLLVFRWKRNAILVMAALALAVCWSFGAVLLELGYLNMITSAFISTLVGVGVAYGIHPVSEYELEKAHCRDPVAAVRMAYHRTGTGITVSAVTTSVAFFSILLMRFRGFAELGLVAGVGVLFCLLATLVTLPAFLILHGRRRHRLEAAMPRRDERTVTMVGRWWVERGAGRVTRFPRTVTLVALALTAVAGWAARDIGFNINMLDLLPADAESLRYQRRMLLQSDLSPFFNVVTARDMEELRRLQEAAAAEPAIGRFDSLLPLLPADTAGAATGPAALRTFLSELRLPPELEPLSAAEMAASLSRLEEALGKAADDAFTAGLMTLAVPLEEARTAAEETRDLAAAAPADQVAAWNTAQNSLLSWSRTALARLQEAATQPAPTRDDLPAAIRQRYLTADGTLLAYLHPMTSIFDADYLDEYVLASKRVDPEATGFPVVYRRMSNRIASGFNRAVMGGAILVMLVLLLDSRSLRDTFLTGLPLAMGIIWMLGGMRLLGLSYNFANLVAVPLIIGVGIDNGVHIMHRWHLEGQLGMDVVLRRTVRAILISSLTTMVGFGSLALASHRGMASLGLLLILGVGACLLTSTLVLPNLILALGMTGAEQRSSLDS